MTKQTQHDTEDGLNRRIMHALETPPVFVIPKDFAARTARLASDRYGVHATPRVFGPRFSLWATQGTMAALTVAMLVFAVMSPRPSLIIMEFEALLALEFAGLMTWLSLRSGDRV